MSKQFKMEKGSLHDRFQKSRAKIQFMGGGFGNGKTSNAVVKALRVAGDYPGANILIARSTYPKLNDTIRKAVLDDWCPKDWIKRRPVKDDNTLILKNDTHINFRYVSQRGKTGEDGTTTSNLLSANYDLIVVDQIEDPEIAYKDFTDLMGRLRGTARYIGSDPTMPMTGPRWMLITANPAMNWVYHKLVKPVHEYRKFGRISEDLITNPATGEPWIELFEGSTYENKLNLEADYIEGLEATYKGQARERFLMGGWAAYEGLVYPDFTPEIHIIPKQQMLNYLNARSAQLRQFFLSPMKARASYDFGLSSPSCYLQAAEDPETAALFIYDGFYLPDARVNVQADYISGMRLEHRAIHTGSAHVRNFEYPPVYADPSIFKRAAHGLSQTTVSQMFGDYGINMFRGANDIVSGLAKVTEQMTIDPHLRNPFTGVEGSPRLFVSDELTWFRDEITGYYWKKNPLGEWTDVPIDRNDHAMDALKYLHTGMPRLEELQKLVRARDIVMNWREEQEHQQDYRHG